MNARRIAQIGVFAAAVASTALAAMPPEANTAAPPLMAQESDSRTDGGAELALVDGGALTSADGAGTALAAHPICGDALTCSAECELGFATSCGELGKRILASPHAPDYAGARAALELACGPYSDGNCELLAVLLRDGLGGPRDERRAIVLFDAACHAGYNSACYEVGVMMLEGRGTPRAKNRARHILGDTCERGHPGACHLYADLLLARLERVAAGKEKMRGGKQALQEALDFLDSALDRACKSGDMVACTDYAVSLARDRSCSETVLGLLRTACSAGQTFACYDADAWDTESYGWGQGSLVRHDNVEAQRMKKQAACEGGDAVRCAELGLLVEHGLVAGEAPAGAETHYARACELGYEPACELLKEPEETESAQ